MLVAQEPNRKRRPPKMFLLSTDMKVQDELEGTIRLQRGNICQEQEAGRGEHPWVKVLDSGSMIRIERKLLLEVPANLVGLLEPVPDPEARFKLLGNPGKLQQLAALAMGAPLWVQTGHMDELLEAELRYVGPLTQGGSAVFFGVQLKGAAAGRGVSNGSVNGRRLFSCPEACALFVPVSQVRPRRWHRSANAPDAQQERGRERAASGQPPADAHHANAHHGSQPHGRHISFRNESSPAPVGVLARTAAAAAAHGPAAGVRGPASPPPFHVGQRVCFPLDESVERGEVRYCGPLPGRSSSGMYVGIVPDAPVGNWDGYFKGEKLCHVPLPIYGLLLPVSKVSAESKPPRHSGPAPSQPPKSILKPLPPVSPSGPPSPPISGPKVALMPPGRAVAKGPPPLPPPKPVHSLPPPLPPPKPHAQPPQRSNGEHSPLRSPGGGQTHVENGEAGAEGELEVGSMVEVNDPPLFGVIRWVGHISGIPEPVAGIELDQELSAGTDGSYLGERHFRCPANKGLFVKLRNCRRDSRFPAPETPVNQVERCNSIAFAEWGSERVEEHTPPLEGEEALQLYQGWKRGIQGHLNSCYLDATLFSLFSCCNSADWLLFWPAEDHPHHTSHQAQDLLRCDIVNPLRRFGYVCASKTMALRRLLEADNSDAGFTNQEKDPEEFLNKLFQLLRVEPLLKIRSVSRQPQQCHLYQLFPPPPTPSPCPSPTSPSSPSVGSPLPLASPLPARMRVASVQALLESSFLHGGLKFVEAPSSLLLLMPRFGKDFKMFDAILPSLSLDITDLLDDTLRQCSICQAVAEWECLQCYEDLDITPGRLKQYCNTCNTQVHAHRKRASHAPLQIGVPGGPWSEPPPCSRRRMSLFAVTCIETSHYVSFVKHGPHAADWLFFDSMADREGGENGFNVPRVKPCPEVGRYLGLSEEELGRLEAGALRESARRLLCDAYMCLYHSPELSLYK